MSTKYGLTWANKSLDLGLAGAAAASLEVACFK